MSLSDTSPAFAARSHIDGDTTIVESLINYHVSEREIGGFHSTETCHPPRFRIPKHFHDLDSIYLVLKGSHTEFYEHKKRHCRSLDVVFTPAGEARSNLFDDAGGRCFLLEVSSNF